jgi:hypothetical protein
MTTERFDDLTKALATSTSRRAAFKTIAATIVGSILGLGGIGTASAAGVKCPRGSHPCGPNCCPNGTSCCPKSGVCSKCP